MFSTIPDLMRIDPLTGCKNFLGLLEDCMVPDPSAEFPTRFSGLKISPDLIINAFQYSAVLFVTLNGMYCLNQAKGFAWGDSAIRWMGILLKEETHQPVYCMRGPEFVVFLKMESEQEHLRFLERILERMNREAKLLEFPGAPADIALIFNDLPVTCLDSLLMQMAEAMLRVKNCENEHQLIFHASELNIMGFAPVSWRQANPADISFSVRWITRASIYNAIQMGKNLDMVQQDAYTDPITNLPNMKTVLVNLEEALRNARRKGKPFSILMMDGDNFREYNNQISYAAGDEAIRAMSAVFKENLRPDDFIARWRRGDEFIVILPDTSAEDAKGVGDRFRLAVRNASRAWRIPLTISIGVSSYPANGEDLTTLLDKAEKANKQAKQQGKDQVVLAEY